MTAPLKAAAEAAPGSEPRCGGCGDGWTLLSGPGRIQTHTR